MKIAWLCRIFLRYIGLSPKWQVFTYFSWKEKQERCKHGNMHPIVSGKNFIILDPQVFRDSNDHPHAAFLYFNKVRLAKHYENKAN
jgi:hypothetical protein